MADHNNPGGHTATPRRAGRGVRVGLTDDDGWASLTFRWSFRGGVFTLKVLCVRHRECGYDPSANVTDVGSDEWLGKPWPFW